MNGAMAEAMSHAAGEENVEKKIEAALSCPCLGDLKDGACGPSFVHAFSCFIRSEEEDKGMDCLDQFKAFQVCLQHNPEHLAKIMAADDGAPPEGADEGASSSPDASSPQAAAAASALEKQQAAPSGKS
ncbi:Mitochondrial intermembrane space import and assembly protein 40 [Chlorella vulgaris]